MIFCTYFRTLLKIKSEKSEKNRERSGKGIYANSFGLITFCRVSMQIFTQTFVVCPRYLLFCQ